MYRYTVNCLKLLSNVGKDLISYSFTGCENITVNTQKRKITDWLRSIKAMAKCGVHHLVYTYTLKKFKRNFKRKDHGLERLVEVRLTIVKVE